MSQTGTDSLGTYTDTGTTTVPTVRQTSQREFHTTLEIDSGSKFTITTTGADPTGTGNTLPHFQPKRPVNHPR